ncbi:hypothetical protein GGX14DRAFT_386858 [Mycena pura]|uniref:Uncharacterized protein n=1 Tax=Mycena pura TaxID=153505 RepID=A0AAD6YMJ9_9AGAR|nr:hypothetical protein GGX14DRAFT_386858 [Mycena pura]
MAYYYLVKRSNHRRRRRASDGGGGVGRREEAHAPVSARGWRRRRASRTNPHALERAQGAVQERDVENEPAHAPLSVAAVQGVGNEPAHAHGSIREAVQGGSAGSRRAAAAPDVENELASMHGWAVQGGVCTGRRKRAFTRSIERAQGGAGRQLRASKTSPGTAERGSGDTKHRVGLKPAAL